MSFEAWPHQTRAVDETLAAIREGSKRICITIPTGGGKTKVGIDLVRTYDVQDRGSIFYTSRKTLIEQS